MPKSFSARIIVDLYPDTSFGLASLLQSQSDVAKCTPGSATKWLINHPLWRAGADITSATARSVAIGIMEAFSVSTAFPLFAIPFATSIVLVLGSPQAGPAQPRALIGGHVVSTLIGLLVVKTFGPAA